MKIKRRRSRKRRKKRRSIIREKTIIEEKKKSYTVRKLRFPTAHNTLPAPHNIPSSPTHFASPHKSPHPTTPSRPLQAALPPPHPCISLRSFSPHNPPTTPAYAVTP